MSRDSASPSEPVRPMIQWRGQALQAAWEAVPDEARHCGHPYLGLEHVLLSLSRCEGGYTARMLERLHLTPKSIRALLRQAAGGPRVGTMDSTLPPTPRLAQLLEKLAAEGAEAEGHELGEKDGLVALLSCRAGVVATIFDWLGYSREDALVAIASDTGPETTRYVPPTILIMGVVAPGGLGVPDIGAMEARIGGLVAPHQLDQLEGPHARGAAQPERSALKRFGRDLSAEARAGTLQQAYGRSALLTRVAQVLARDTANNPVLVGEAGVGKTALVEGLAWRLAQTDRPIRAGYHLEEARIIAINLTSLSADTGIRGEFEKRLQAIITEALADPRIILFFDELHTLVGAGRASGALDAAQMLKPALARRDFRCIGATTQDEFDRFIAADAALARRFERVVVPELTDEDTLAVLHDWRADYERRWRVVLPDDTLRTAVQLTSRYVPQRRFPEKALTALDDARLLATTGGLGLSLNVDELLAHKQEPQRDRAPGGDSQGHELHGEDPPVVVTSEQVTAAVEQIAGIRIATRGDADYNWLVSLEGTLRRRVVGQDQAVATVARVLRAARAGVRSPTRPEAVLLFCGPAGVGKTELALALAEAAFGPGQFHHFDMAEFGERHTAQRLIGAPPSYVGHEHGGELTSWLSQHPHSVVLFDEIEKAHEEVLDSLLSLFDTGRLTDGRGRDVSGRDAVFVMTSNLLTHALAPRSLGFSSPGLTPDPDDRQVRMELREHLRREFIDRIDEVVLFRPLSSANLEEIIALQLSALARQVEQTRGVYLTFDRSIYQAILARAANSQNGARELARTAQRILSEPLSLAFLSASLRRGAQLHVRVGAKGEIAVEMEKGMVDRN